MELHDLDNRFNYHAPDDDKKARHEAAREACKTTAHVLNRLCGDDSREKSLAITHLEEAMFWANAAIARVSAGGFRN